MNIPFLIPIHNEEKNLEELILNLSRQEVKPFIILVDNNSTDSSPTLLKVLCSQHSLENVILFEPQKGQNFAINRGMQFAKNELKVPLVFKFDADSRLHTVTDTLKLNSSCKHIDHQFGFSFGPMPYVDFGNQTLVEQVCTVGHKIILEIMQNIGWFSIGSNSVVPVDDYLRFSDTLKDDLLDSDLVFSLSQLNNGKLFKFIDAQVDTSARRLIERPTTFLNWSLDYDKYTKSKQGIEKKTVDSFGDLLPIQEQLVKGRIAKIVNFVLIPMLIFDKSNRLKEKLEDFVGVSIYKLLPKLSDSERLTLLKDQLPNAQGKSEWIRFLSTLPIFSTLTGLLCKKLRPNSP